MAKQFSKSSATAGKGEPDGEKKLSQERAGTDAPIDTLHGTPLATNDSGERAASESLRENSSGSLLGSLSESLSGGLDAFPIDTIPYVAGAFSDVPRELGDYTLTKSLGKGAMGIVYEAVDKRSGARVALKTINPAIVRSLSAFKQEFRALAEISHPHLIAFGELVTQDAPQPFFTMELVEGSPFTEYVRPEIGAGGRQNRGELRIDRLRPAILQLAEGLQALHDAAKLHRDIKPTNVLASSAGRVVILDFGLAVELDGDEFENSRREIAGTFYYMSPEQHAGEKLSPASDWYSVGVMLYESLTGRLPFTGSLEEIRERKRAGEFAPAGEVDAQAPADLADLCREMLAPAPEGRPSGPEIVGRLRGESARVRGQTSWVGREKEIGALQRAWREVCERKPLAAFVCGESGMGKTALVQRFLAWLREQPEAVILRGRCYENESVPYKVFDGLVDSLADYLRRLDEEALTALLPRDGASLGRVFPALREALAFAPEGYDDQPVWDPQEIRRRGFLALRELLSHLANKVNLALFIDDVQWGDGDSARLFADLTRLPGAPPVLWLCAYRSEDAARSQFLRQILGGASEAGHVVVGEAEHNADDALRSSIDKLEISVGALLPDDAKRLATDLMPGAGADEIDAVARESGGSPLFLHVLAQRYADGRGAARGERSRETQASPPTLDDVLWEQIEHLSDEQRAMLESIAVAGQPLPRKVLHRATGLARSDLLAYNELRHRHFLKSVGADESALTDSAPVEAYHDRIRETVARRLSAERLADRSRRLAEALEAEPGQRDPRLLAGLHRQAGNRRLAGQYFVQAAEEAQSALAFARAAMSYRDALDALKPAGQEDSRLRESLGDALANAGRTAEAAEEYTRAAKSAEAGKAADLRCRAALRYLTSGHVDQGLAILEEVLAAEGLRLPASPALAVASLLWRRCRLWIRGLEFTPCAAGEAKQADVRQLEITWAAAAGLSMVDPVRAADFVSRYLLLALKIGEPNAILRGLNVQIGHLAIGGSKSRGVVRQYLQKTRETARLAPGPRASAARELSRGVAAHLRGEWRAARKSCDRAASYLLDKRCQDVAWDLDTAQTFSMWALTYSGEAGEATRRHPDLLRKAREHNDLFAILNFGTTVATFAYLSEDQPADLRRHLQDDKARLSDRGFFVQHHNWLLASTTLELYEGRGVEAWELIGGGWRGYRKSFLDRVQHIRIDFFQTRARAALAAATQATGRQRATLITAAEGDARKLHGEKTAWAEALALLVRAGALSQRGDKSRAAERYRDAATQLQAVDMKLFAAAARARLAELSESKQDRAAAFEEMRALGIRRPEKIARSFAPATTMG